MKSFPVDDDLVDLVWQLAKPQPFENLSFNDALRRVFASATPKALPRKSPSADELLAELAAMGKKVQVKDRLRAPSPNPRNWLSQIPELRSKSNLRTWQDICAYFHIDVGGDSARRKLKEWVQSNHPNWPVVPDV